MLTRRQIVVGGVTVGAALALPGRARALAARARAGADEGTQGERVLVVVQLTGGNDGLNTVVPLRQDAYHRLRPTLAVGPRKALALDGDFGLNPALQPAAKLFQDGKLAVVHGVGFPGPSRSHFRAMEIWHTAEPDKPAGEVGWLGRMADQLAQRDPAAMPLLHIGSGPLPLSARARRAVPPSFESEHSFRLTAPHPQFTSSWRELSDLPRAGDRAYVRDTARAAHTAVERLSALAGKPERAEYPGYELARQLRLVARLVVGGFGTRLFALELGNFDTHARQARSHEDLLRQLSESLAAFEKDLAAHGWSDRVTTLVFSEFGRRAAENASLGTDHGAGGPVLLVGGGVRGGLHGTAPDLEHLVDGDVPHTVDLRALYAGLESRWLGLTPSSGVAPLDVVRA